MFHRALRFCIGLRRFTPCNVVYAEFCISPAHFKADLLANKLILKSFAIKPHPLIDRPQSLYVAHFVSGFHSDLINIFKLLTYFLYIELFALRRITDPGLQPLLKSCCSYSHMKLRPLFPMWNSLLNKL